MVGRIVCELGVGGSVVCGRVEFRVFRSAHKVEWTLDS